MRASRPFGLTREEGLGLFVAIAAHVALVAALTLSPLGRNVQPPPQRMTVSLADAVSDQSTSPKPDAQAAPAMAQDLGEPMPADQPLPAPAPEPKVVAKPLPKPVAKPLPKPEPAPVPKPVAKPIAKPVPKPVVKPTPEPKPKPEPKVEHKPETKPETKPKPEAKPEHAAKAKPDKPAKPDAKPAGGEAKTKPHPDKPAGAGRIGDILNGISTDPSPGRDKVSPGDKESVIPAATLVSAISRQIKPHWSAPQGVDTDKLVTVLAWSLNADGSLAGRPVVVSQSGITDTNRAQAQRHAELAIRAVILAAPFPLPAQAYAQWHHVAAFRFDRKLSQ